MNFSNWNLSLNCSDSSEQFKNGEGIDRISGLPDEILGHILSFLPTKHAVGSSILSRRWRYVYTLITNFDFDEELVFHSSGSVEKENRARFGTRPKSHRSFKDFVDRVLMLCRPTHISKFRVKCDKDFDCSNVNAWINFALRGGVTELDVFTYLFSDNLLLPLSLFVCETLVVLKLHGNFELKFPNKLLLPHLKSLELNAVTFSEDCSLNDLISGCPLLEDLVLTGGRGDVETINISSSSVRRLTVDFREIFMSSHKHRINVMLNLPNLLHCNYKDYLAENYCIKNLNSLEDARIDIVLDIKDTDWDIFCDSVLGLINGVSSANHLYFSGESMEALDSDFELPTFNNLASLEIGNSRYVSWEAILPDFLYSSPILENLVFPEGLLSNFEYDGQDFGRNLHEPPICLSSHLKSITISPFYGFDEELSILKYLFKHGKVISKLILYSVISSKKEYRNLKKLLKIGRIATNECLIELV